MIKTENILEIQKLVWNNSFVVSISNVGLVLLTGIGMTNLPPIYGGWYDFSLRFSLEFT